LGSKTFGLQEEDVFHDSLASALKMKNNGEIVSSYGTFATKYLIKLKQKKGTDIFGRAGVFVCRCSVHKLNGRPWADDEYRFVVICQTIVGSRRTIDGGRQACPEKAKRKETFAN